MSKVRASETTYNSYCEQKIAIIKKNMVTRIVIVVILWLLIIAYLISPFSKAKIVEIKGNNLNFTSSYISEVGDFSQNSFLWSVNYRKAKENLVNHRYINDIEFKPSILGLTVIIDEVVVVGKNEEEDTKYFLSDGTSVRKSSLDFNDPLKPDYTFIGQYSKLPLIEETTFENENFRLLYHNLGHINHELLTSINCISKANEFENFTCVKMQFSKEDLNLEQDLELYCDVKYLSKLVTVDNVNLVATTAKNNQQYRYIISEDIENIKIMPYSVN